MKNVICHLSVIGAFSLVFAGCGGASSEPAPAASSAPESSTYLLGAEPAEAKDVIAARTDTKNDEAVVVVGRIGGDMKPWIEGRAAFSIVDRSLVPCNEREGDDCPTPWDYCCDTDKFPEAKALVKVVDEAGKLVGTDARELLGVKELQTVVVKGKAQRDEAGNLTVLADGVYVRP